MRGDTHVSAARIAISVVDTNTLQAAVSATLRRTRRKVLVVANGKGGVGKSSLAADVAGGLARIGKRVLLVEMDPQGNNAEDLGFIDGPLYDSGASQAQALLEGTGLKPTGEARPGLWVVPGGEALEDVIEELYCQRRAASEVGRDTWLYMYAAAIWQVADDYDFVILDVAPGSLVLQLQAMVAGDMVLVPCRSDASSRKGLRTVARRFRDALPYNPSLRLIGIVLFGVTTMATRVKDEMRQLLAEDVQGAAPVFQTPIRYVEKAAVECRKTGLLPHELARMDDIDRGLAKSLKGLASDYRSLTMELMTEIAQLVRQDAA
jgi:chromosome partitioning protein